MHKWTRLHTAGLSILLLAICSSDAPSFGVRRLGFTWAVHEDITREAARALSPDKTFSARALEEIVTGNRDTDLAHSNEPILHFDNDSIVAARKRMSQETPNIVALAHAGKASEARMRLGTVLHSLQDFYSHSTYLNQGARSPVAIFDINDSGANTALNTGLSTVDYCDALGAFTGSQEQFNARVSTGHYQGVAELSIGITGPTRVNGHLVCRHGEVIDPQTGVNKDTPLRTLHANAKSVAVEATRRYLTYLLAQAAVDGIDTACVLLDRASVGCRLKVFEIFLSSVRPESPPESTTFVNFTSGYGIPGLDGKSVRKGYLSADHPFDAATFETIFFCQIGNAWIPKTRNQTFSIKGTLSSGCQGTSRTINVTERLSVDADGKFQQSESYTDQQDMSCPDYSEKIDESVQTTVFAYADGGGGGSRESQGTTVITNILDSGGVSIQAIKGSSRSVATAWPKNFRSGFFDSMQLRSTSTVADHIPEQCY